MAAAARTAAEHAAEALEHATVAKRHALDATTQTGLQALALQGVQKELQTLGGKIDTLIATVGAEEVDRSGQTVGTGLCGRIVRIERRVRDTDIWRDRLKVAITTALPLIGIFGGLLWWLTSPQLTALFHGVKP